MPGQLKILFDMFEKLEIASYRKAILQERYLNVLKNFETRANRLSCIFYSSRTIVTVGSILVPAFLSIQSGAFQLELYWVTWIISVLVTICNGLVALFKFDKKYFFIHTSLELLKSEGWQYIGLSGRYAPKDSPEKPTHENQFLTFFHMAEKIKMRQVEEEYWKFTDTSGVGNATNQQSMALIQTPIIQQGAIAKLPVEKRTIIEGWMEDMKSPGLMAGVIPRDTLENTSIIDGTHSPPGIFAVKSETNLPVLYSV